MRNWYLGNYKKKEGEIFLSVLTGDAKTNLGSKWTPLRGDPGELSHKDSWSTPIIFKTSHLFDLFFLQ